MAHTFVKPEVIVASALGQLVDKLLLARLVTRKSGADFVGAKDDTINQRIPALLDARTYAFRNDRSNPIVTDELTELSIPIVLNQMPYSAVALTDEQLTLDIRDLTEQVIKPQADAIAKWLDALVGTLMAAGTDYKNTISVTEGSSDPWDDVIVEARRLLNVENVPADNRVLLLGADVEAWFLKQDLFKKANESGSRSVLENAVIGRLGGFTLIGNCNAVASDSAFAFHPSAYVLANMAPRVPIGVKAGATQEYEGFSLRWIQDYDTSYLRDRSVFSSFAGTASVEDERDESHALTTKNVRAIAIDFEAVS